MGKLETVETQTKQPVGLTYEIAGDLTDDELFELAIQQLRKSKQPPGYLTISKYRQMEQERTGQPIGRFRAQAELDLLVENCGWQRKKTGAGWIYWFDGNEGTTGEEAQGGPGIGEG